MKFSKNDVFKMEEDNCQMNIKNKIYIVKRNKSNEDYEYYIFAGLLPEKQYEMLIEINSTKIKPLSDSHVETELMQYIGKDYEYIIEKTIDPKTVIVNSEILIDDTLSNIKNKILCYLSSSTETFNITEQYLWINKKTDWDLNTLSTIFYNVAKNKKISKEEFLELISKITCRTDCEIDLSDYDENIEYNNFVQIFKTNQCLKYIAVTLDFTISIDNKREYYIANPLIFIEDTNMQVEYDSSKKNSKIVWNNNKILESFGEIEDNIINLNYLPDMIDILKLKKIDYTEEIVFFSFFQKYWPNIEKKKIGKKSKKNFRDIKKYIDLTNKFWKLYYNGPNNQYYFKNCGITQAVIQVNYPLDINFIDLKKIFDLYELDYDVPFMKYNFKSQNDTKYKIYTPITKENENGPIIKESELLNWKKNYMFDKMTGKLKNTSNANCLGLKILFDIVKLNPDKKYSENKGNLLSNKNKNYLILNIFQNSRLEIKINCSESQNAQYVSLRNAVKKVHEIIKKINKINFSNTVDKIQLPDTKFLDKFSFNTKLVSLSTYIITENLVDMTKISKNINNVTKYLYPFLKMNNDVKSKKNTTDLSFKYRRVNEFEDMDAITSYISELYNNEKKENEIIALLMQSFNLEKVEDAKMAYNHWFENVKGEIHSTGNGFIVKSKNNPGISLKLNLIDTNKLNILVDGISEINYLSRVNYFINSIFKFCKDNKLNKDLKAIYDSYNKSGYEDYLTVDDDGDNKLAEIVTELNENITILENNGEGNMGLDDYQYLLDNIDEDDEDDEEKNEEKNEEHNKKQKEEKKIQPGKTIKKEISAFDFKKSNISRYFSLRLTKMDPVLFAQSTNYTKSCQNVQNKQPVVITKEQLDAIDKNDEELSKRYNRIGVNKFKSYTYSLKYGSKENYNNYFICPLVWCIRCELSLPYDKEVLLVNPTDNIFTESKCPICNGSVIIDPKNVKENETLIIKLKKKEKTDKFSLISEMDKPYFLSAKHEDGYCWPCCGSKNKENDQETKICLGEDVKEKNIIKDSKEYKNMLYILDSSKSLDNDRLGILPEELSQLFGNKKNNIKDSKLKEKATEFLRYGVHKSELHSFLLNLAKIYNKDIKLTDFINLCIEKLDPINFVKAYQGDLVILFNLNGKNFIENEIDKVTLFNWLEKYPGIKNIFELSENSTLDVPVLTTERSKITSKLSNSEKKNYNLLFIIYNSFENFKEYLRSNTLINQEYLWMLFSFPLKDIFPNGLNMFFFEIDNLSAESEVSMLCPNVCNPEEYYDESRSNIFFLKKKNNYELIVKANYEGSDSDQQNKLRIIFKHELSDNYHIIDGLRYYFINSCKILNTENNPQFSAKSASTIIDFLNKIGNKKKNFLPKLQVIDNYFRTIGILTEDNTFVVTNPSSINTELKIISDISMYTMDAIKLYNNLENIFKKTKTDIICMPDKYISVQKGTYKIPTVIDKKSIYVEKERKKYNRDWIIGIKFKNGLIIPTVYKKIDEKSDLQLPISYKFYDSNINDEILYDIPFIDKRIVDINQMIFSEESYELLRYELSKYLNFEYNSKINKIIVLEKEILLLEEKIEITKDPVIEKEIKKKRDILNKFKKQDNSFDRLKNYREEIYNILNDFFITNIEKRNKLYIIFDEIVNKLAVVKKINHEIFENSELFKNSSLRKRCTLNTKSNTCNKDIFCSWTDSKCKLNIPETDILTNMQNNRDRFIFKIIDELIRNKFKRDELLEDNITQRTNTYQSCDKNTCILTDTEINEGELHKLYENGKKKYIREISLFDTDIENVEKKLEILKKTNVEESYCNEALIELPNSWEDIFDSNFKILSNDGNSDCTFQIIATVLNNHPSFRGESTPFTSNIVRKQVSENVFSISNKKNLSEISNDILQFNHWCSLSDLEIISDTYNIIFIIINKKKTSNKSKNIKIIDSSTQTSFEDFVLLYEDTVKGSKLSKFELIYQPDFAYYFSNDLAKPNSLPGELIKLFKYNKYKSVYHFIDTNKIDFKSTGKILGFIIKDDVYIKCEKKKKVTLYKNPPKSTKITTDYKVKDELIVLPKMPKPIEINQTKINIEKTKKSKKKSKELIFADAWKSNGLKANSSKVKPGICIFPFKTASKIYDNECVPNKSGSWCATSVTGPISKKKSNVNTWGYCVICSICNKKFELYKQLHEHIDEVHK